MKKKYKINKKSNFLFWIGILLILLSFYKCHSIHFTYEKGKEIKYLNDRQMKKLNIQSPEKVLVIFEHDFKNDTLLIINGPDTLLKTFPDHKTIWVDGIERFNNNYDLIIKDKKIKQKIIIPLKKKKNYKFVYLRRIPKGNPKKEWNETKFKYYIVFTNTFRRYK